MCVLFQPACTTRPRHERLPPTAMTWRLRDTTNGNDGNFSMGDSFGRVFTGGEGSDSKTPDRENTIDNRVAPLETRK